MGGTFSAAIGRGITREQLLKSTEKPRETMNLMFNKMLSTLTPEDFLKLGRAQTCSQFVFMMADSLHQIFDDLRIRPKKDRDSGVIFFQKVSTLTAQTQVSKELCLYIAYFYIRLFQIFGALAITITDDPGAGHVLAATRYAPPVQTEGRGFFSQQKRIPGSRGTYLGVGGARPEYFQTGKAAAFAPIREVFEDGRMEPSTLGSEPRVTFTFREFPGIVFIPDRKDKNGRSQNIIIALPNNSHLCANMNISVPSALLFGTNKFKITLDNFSLHDKTRKLLLKAINTQIGKYTESFDITTNDGGLTWMSGSVSFKDKLAEGIKHTLDIIRELFENPRLTLKDVKSIPAQQRAALAFDRPSDGIGIFRDRRRDTTRTYDEFGNPLDGRRDETRSVFDAAGAKPGSVGSVGGRDVGTPSPLQSYYLIDTLKGATGQKSVSFCVARALQLIDANSLFRLRSTEGAKSSVCTKFDAPSQSVPQPGQSLDKMSGMKALDQLYHTQPSITQDGVRVGVAVTASDEYAEFLNGMMTLFGRPGSTKPTGVEKILVNTPDCGPQLVNKYLQIKDPKEVNRILAIVNQMFSRQLAHTKTVLKFFETRLFLMKRGPDRRISIDIHPKILQGGIDELDKVSKEARELLVGYYTNCEKVYQEGMKLVLQARPTPIA